MPATCVAWYVPHGNRGLSKHGDPMFPPLCPRNQNPGFPRNPSLASLPLFFTVCSVPRAPARQMVVRLILCLCLEGAGSREPAKPGPC